MLSRRKFLLTGSASLGAGATMLALGTPKLLPDATAAAPAGGVAEALATAPPPFVSLADQLSGQIGVDRVLVNSLHSKLLPVIPNLDALAEKLAAALPKVAGIADPAERLQALAGEDAAIKDLFVRLNTGLYLGTVDDKDGQRQCIGFESAVAYQAVADFVQPPSYCVGSPNFWVDPPATAATAPAQETPHV